MRLPKLHQSSKSFCCKRDTNVRPRQLPRRVVIFADEKTGLTQTTGRTKGAGSSLRTPGVQTRLATKVKSASGIALFEPAPERQ